MEAATPGTLSIVPIVYGWVCKTKIQVEIKRKSNHVQIAKLDLLELNPYRVEKAGKGMRNNILQLLNHTTLHMRQWVHSVEINNISIFL